MIYSLCTISQTRQGVGFTILTKSDFANYLTRCKQTAAPSLYVLGHPAPDGDAVLSSLFEGWRLTLQGTPAVPLVQAAALPQEVAWLLEELAPLVLTGEAPRDPACRFVLTDHHHDPLRQAQVVRVVDHHIPPPTIDLSSADTLIAPVGATVTLVTRLLQEQGYTPDGEVARLLLGGILLDTDGLSAHKAKEEDLVAAGWLSSLCGEPPAPFYAALQAQLLGETDVVTLYRRDYRTYHTPDGEPLMGFAILKVWDTARPDLTAVRRLLAQDAARGDCSVYVAKIMCFTPDGGWGEQLCLAAGAQAETVLAELLAVEGAGAVRTAPDLVTLSTTCPRRGRKWYAAHLLPLLAKN